MAFELIVKYKKLPSDLKALWESAFAELGHLAEFHPSFDPSNWQGGFLPVRLQIQPNPEDDFADKFGSEPILAGFEVSFAKKRVTFVTTLGRTTADFRAQCLAAATLANIVDGTYEDPQSGEKCTGSDAIRAACEQISEFETSASEREWRVQRFSGWEANA